jgi:hypothetical protein
VCQGKKVVLGLCIPIPPSLLVLAFTSKGKIMSRIVKLILSSPLALLVLLLKWLMEGLDDWAGLYDKRYKIKKKE